MTAGTDVPYALAGLPEDVRRAVVEVAAAALPRVPEPDVPGPLRRFRTSPPRKRAAAAGPALGAALAGTGFRLAVAAVLRTGDDLPTDAAHAWLLRPDGWEATVQAAADLAVEAGLVRTAQQAQRTDARDAARLVGRLQAAEARAADLDAELGQVREQAAALRRQVSAGRPAALEAARAELAAALADRDAALAEAAGQRSRADAQSAAVAALTAGVARLQGELDALRSAGRRERTSDTARLRVLVDTLVAAGQGLRQELSLPPVPTPGQLLDEARGASSGNGFGAAGGRGLGLADPALLDALLAAPGLHLLVDGYNVTKTGWPALTLEQQRDRLVGALASLQARTAAEVTVVFDGAARPVLATIPRSPGNVRVVWSPVGVTADDVILEHVAAEPAGRPVLVVSSDRAVVDGAARQGARAVPSALLVARLSRA